MKKIMIAAVLGFGLAQSAFAGQSIRLDSQEAIALADEMVNAGAERKVYTDASFVGISNVNCSESSAFVVMPMQCSFTDANTKEVKNIEGETALRLVNALKNAGLQVVSIQEGELHKENLSAKSVQCSSTAVPNVSDCELQK